MDLEAREARLATLNYQLANCHCSTWKYGVCKGCKVLSREIDALMVGGKPVSESPETTPIQEHEGRKYLRQMRDVGNGGPFDVDVYCVLEAFKVTCPARQHALKKLLCAGTRGKGTEIDDLRGVIAAVNRAIELQEARKTP